MPKVPRIIPFLENFLFFWLGLALLLSFAGAYLEIPPLLQVLGRTHPLILHFPIVLLLMAVGLFWLSDEKFKQTAAHILLAGANLTGLTVVAGLLLANEDYEGDALAWHQWLGVASLGLSVLIYFYRNESQKILRIATLTLAVAIVLTGHFGANLTHGEDFLLAPIKVKESEFVALEDAEVFQHLVQPILESKCIACHKEGKIKGELRMDKIEGLQKGGKSGPFVVPGDLNESLLVQRINLPADNEEHMPPKNKAQLTEEELEILQLWVAAGGSFDQKVTELKTEEPLFQFASNKFSNEKVYDFKAASESDIKSLNNFFRKVTPVYPGSPALEVAYYGTSAFDPASLKDLRKVNEQVVKLNLNRMPLGDLDLGFLKDFKNLEEIQLNFTGIKVKQLQVLSQLENLRNLAISGNDLGNEAVSELSQFKNIKKLFFWQSGLDEASQKELQKNLPTTAIDFGFSGKGIIYALNPPKIGIDVVVFKDSIELKLSHPIRTTDIRYTIDGTIPDSINSPKYSPGIWIKSSTEIKAKAFAPDWKGSTESTISVFKSGIKAKDITLKNQPHDRYKANGPISLIDGIKGKPNHTSGDWLGYQTSTLDAVVELNPGQQPKEITLSLLYHEAAHIFPPEQVNIWIENNSTWEKVPVQKPEQSAVVKETRLAMLKYSLPEKTFSKIKIEVVPVSKLPAWHQGAGSKGWVFMDEILFN
jgi:uncharacterized membrane protein